MSFRTGRTRLISFHVTWNGSAKKNNREKLLKKKKDPKNYGMNKI